MKNKFPLTPEITKEIEEIAKKLPKFQKWHNGKPMNRELHRQEVEIAGKKQTLKMCEPVLVNHKLNLMTDYQTHGREGIKNYLAEIELMIDRCKDDPTFQQMNN